MKFVIGLFLLVAVSQANATTLRSRVQSLAGTKFFDLQSTIAELKELDKDGCNALHHAATLGNLSLFKFLVDIGVDANGTDKNRLRPIDYATREAEVQPTVQQMMFISHILEITRGVNGIDGSRWPPIYWAILAGDLERVRDLIDKGTNDNILYNGLKYDWRNGTNTDAYSLALLMEDDKIIELLTTMKNKILLGDAVLRLNTSRIKKLVKEGGDLNAIRFNNKTTTALVLGMYEAADDVKYFNFLTELGADVNASNQDGLTPLAKAKYSLSKKEMEVRVRRRVQNIIDFLEDKGAKK